MSLSPEFLQFITQYTNAILNKINRTITRKITTTFQDSDEVIPSSKLVKDEFTTVRGEIPTKTSDLTNDSGFLTEHQDISGKEDKSNKVTSLSNNSTDDEYPSAKTVYTGLNSKANSSHTHDDRYYTETEINTKLSDYLTTDDASTTYQPKGNYLTSHNPIDTALSSTSTNAVQNKVINTALGNKVDKVSGKGLSTNDFTSSYKTALDNLNTTIANAVSNLEMIEVVTSLPTTDIKTNKLYLKANTVNGSENKYDFYVRVNDAWEKIDSLDFSISDYIKKSSTSGYIKNDGTVGTPTNTTYSADNSTLQLSSTTFSVKDGGITNAKLADKSSLITEYIVGTHGTTATPTWTGTSTKITSLQAGQVIYFKMTSAGTTAGDTLNLTLANGTTTGAKQIYYNGTTTKLTTHFPVNTVLQLIYDGTSWRCTAIQDTNNYDRIGSAAQVINGESTQIANGTLIYGKSDGNYYKIAADGTLDIRYPILCLGAAVNSGSPATNIYSTYSNVNITTTVSGKSLTASKMCYLEGTLNENIFTISSKVFVSDDALENGKYYIALGYMTNATNLRFTNNDRTIYTRTSNKLIPVGHTTPQKTSELINDSGFLKSQDITSRVISVNTSNFSKQSWIPMLAGVYNYNPSSDPSSITREQYETLIGKEVNYDEIAESVFYTSLSSSFNNDENSFLISFGIETFEGTTRRYLGYKYSGAHSNYSIFPVNTPKEDIANKTTQISQASTDTEYPSAKAVYDAIPSETITLTATLENGTTVTYNVLGYQEQQVINNGEQIN